MKNTDNEGPKSALTPVEWGLVAALVAVIIIGTASSLNNNGSATFETVSEQMSSPATENGPTP